ncbi:hypothetical protein [Verrucomicrobium spinosum]|uniref:hypothetical protein n=1 Tax=Verrucomicrobium spinosum TaxID=2736 RepID=UPI000B2FB683|nr:hypothetical protein [Verrucomicrobium spinosum]
MAAMFAGVRHGTRPVAGPDHEMRLARAAKIREELAPVVSQLNHFEPVAFAGRTVVIPPDDATRVVKLKPSNAQRTKYEAGPGRGENAYPGDNQNPPTLADGYWVWLGDNAAGKVLAWQPQVQVDFASGSPGGPAIAAMTKTRATFSTMMAGWTRRTIRRKSPGLTTANLPTAPAPCPTASSGAGSRTLASTTGDRFQTGPERRR